MEQKFNLDDDMQKYVASQQDQDKFINELIRKHKEEHAADDEKNYPRPQNLAEMNDPTKSNGYNNTWLLFVGGIAVICVFVASLKMCESSFKAISYDRDSTEVTNLADTTLNSYKSDTNEQDEGSWSFRFEKDPMSDTQNIWANIYSDNTINMDFPYETTKATITVRYMKKYGYNVLIGVTSGQIYGNSYYNENYIMARFDDNKPIKYWFDETSDGSSDVVFLRKTSDFIMRCKKAHTIIIEIPLYDSGRPVFEFSTTKPLKWRDE